METTWNKFNVSQAQWSIDEYCPKENKVSERPCKACQEGWVLNKSSCYLFYDADLPDQKTWGEAREDCRGRSSDFIVIDNKDEQDCFSCQYVIQSNSWHDYEYWIGLRAEGGRWKWIDGSDLNESDWIQGQPTNGQCAVSVQDNRLKKYK
ncbi:NKG2-D type II integral membrane protein-like isoform X1 [Perca flavescens]|uniref:NKG2-D type II integral membrane protein-like isoform X1 n=1 Tax=Perca flavescens TaxID=8167 RepID=UPI00106EE51C|nr:NKG2-D type II integral membrane protein-like isoform X1 [Perca flavescens]